MSVEKDKNAQQQSKMTNQHAPTFVEQLWYTWSDTGLGRLRAGMRIRAASEGLSDIDEPRVQRLDYYQRYTLPQDADPATPTSFTPICLSFIITPEQERLLVYKTYIGKDLIGRDGNFFVHLLAGLPDKFSAFDAITLWGQWGTEDSLWKNSDRSISHDEIYLPFISVKDLWKKGRNSIARAPHDKERVRACLPYLIHAYLTRQLQPELAMQQKPKKRPRQSWSLFSSRKPVQPEPSSPRQVRHPIYIAAPDQDIAQMIFGLTCCLPARMVKDMTFSTYESDLAGATTEIIGTCWLSLPHAENDSHVRDLLPLDYYSEKVALNGYTGKKSLLTNEQLFEQKPSASDFARDAAKFFFGEHNRKFLEKFQMLLAICEDANTDELLQNYESFIVRDEDPIELLFKSSNDEHIAKQLVKQPLYLKALIALLLYNPQWWENKGKARLQRLRTASAKIVALVQILATIAQLAIEKAVEIVQEQVILSRPGLKEESGITEDKAFHTMIEVMLCVLPPDQGPEVWNTLLRRLIMCEKLLPFLYRYGYLYETLMLIWSRTLSRSSEDMRLIRPLFSISWEQSPGKMRLLFHWLAQPMDFNTLEVILTTAHLSASEQIEFLEQYGASYISLYPQSAILLNYIYSMLLSLWSSNIEIFKDSPSPDIPSRLEKILQSLYNTGVLYNFRQTMADWLLIAACTRQTKLLQERIINVAESVSRLQRQHPLGPETYTRLFDELAVACLESNKRLGETILDILRVLEVPHFMYLLNMIAQIARVGIYDKRYPKSLFMRCITFALFFKQAFLEKDEQDYFMRSFLDTLLQGVDQKTLDWLNAQMKEYALPTFVEWQRYTSHHAAPPAFFKSVALRLERRIVTARVQSALRNRNTREIERLAIEHIAMLVSDTHLSNTSWEHIKYDQINDALYMTNNDEERTAQTSDLPAWRKLCYRFWDKPHRLWLLSGSASVLLLAWLVGLLLVTEADTLKDWSLLHGLIDNIAYYWLSYTFILAILLLLLFVFAVISLILSHIPALLQPKIFPTQVGEQQANAKNTQGFILRWRLAVIFLQIWLALEYGHVGRIVYLITEHRAWLARNVIKLSAQRWNQIKAAFTFFFACISMRSNPRGNWAQNILAASSHVESLSKAGQPTLHLTFSEKRLKELATYHSKALPPVSLQLWVPRTLRLVRRQEQQRHS